jgi:hypothetical protein
LPSLNNQLEKNSLLTLAYFDLLLRHLRILLLFSMVPDRKTIFYLYSTALQVQAVPGLVPPTLSGVELHLNK